MALTPYPNFFQGSEWVKRFDSDTGTLRDALGVQVVKVEGLTGTTLEQALQAAEAFDTLADAGSQTIPSNMEIKEVRQRVVTDGIAQGRVVYGRDDAPVGRIRQRPLVTVDQQILTINIPMATAYTGGSLSVDVDGGGDVLYRPVTILQSNITIIEESSSTSISLGGALAGKTNSSPWHGLDEESVLYLGKGVNYYRVGSTVKQDIRHSFVHRMFIKPTAANLNDIKPHSIVRYDKTRNIVVEAPDPGAIPEVI